MFNSRHLKYVVASAVTAVVLAAMQSPARAEFAAPLVECNKVTQPDKLANCGNDAFSRGSVRVNDVGHLEVVLVEAVGPATYSIVFRSPDGTKSSAPISLSTNAKGNGTVNQDGAFAFQAVGAGSLVLTRAGSDQFVSGFSIAPNAQTEGGPDFRAGLVVCGSVTVPGTLAGCGSDNLKSGSVDFESDDGDATVRLHGAGANQTYTAVVRAPNGTQTSLGTFPKTDSKGNSILTATIAAGTVGSGTVVVQRGGSDEFLSGFDVTHKPGPKTLSKSSLVRCIDVNLGGSLPNCGTDPLDHGSVTIDQNGKVTFSLNGAAPNNAYEVSFRPLDTTGASDIDTTVGGKTDQNGNIKQSGNFSASSGETGAGSFVVKGGGFDQFVPGFAVK